MKNCSVCGAPVSGKGRKNCLGVCQKQYRENYKKRYRSENHDKIKSYADSRKEIMRQYYSDHKEIIKQQRSVSLPKWYANKLREMETNILKRIKYLHKARLTDAKRKGVQFDLTVEMLHVLFMIQDGKCAITGIEFDMKFTDDYRSAPFGPSVDKKDARKGYTIDNVQFVCFMVNMGKGEYPQELFDQMCLARAKVLIDAKV